MLPNEPTSKCGVRIVFDFLPPYAELLALFPSPDTKLLLSLLIPSTFADWS